MAKGNHNYSKQLREQYAFQVLQFLDSNRYHALEKHESPDYITPGHEIGVEVVSVSQEGSREAESLFSRIERGESRNSSSDIDRLTKLGVKLIRATDENLIGFVEPARWATFEPVKTTVKKKLELLNSNYTKCFSNELFIYSEIGPVAEGWESHLSQLREISESFSVHFSRIILNEPWLLIVFDIDGGRCKKVEFTNEDYKNCCNACQQHNLLRGQILID